jgi:hypothetical protein
VYSCGVTLTKQAAQQTQLLRVLSAVSLSTLWTKKYFSFVVLKIFEHKRLQMNGLHALCSEATSKKEKQ